MYLFHHTIGSFVFDEDFRILDNGPEKKLQKKYPQLITITEQNISAYKNALLALKSLHYLHLFYEQNREATKKALHSIANNDTFIIQTIHCLDDVMKVRDILMHRLGDWCSIFYPEINKTKELLSIDLTVENADALPLRSIIEQLNTLSRLWEEEFAYLQKVMQRHCPNLAAVAGYELGGRLLVLSGSLEALAKMASSKLQLLGAEKAFFRHLMHQKPLPKHGIIVIHPLVKKAEDEKKVNVVRVLADKLSIAVKVDYFKGEYVGDKLRKEVEAV